MNVVDSSAWLEYFANGPNASFFAKPIEDSERLFVPTIAIFEVFKQVLQQRTEGDALQAIADIRQGIVVGPNASIASWAAKLSVEHGLPMADSVILATTRARDATLWTQDADLKDLPGVQYRPRRP